MPDKFEDIVYRCPGEHSLPGGSYSYLGVKSEEELERALSDGWFNTVGEAIEGKAAKVKGDTEGPGDKKDDDSTPPTREEMELKAKELKAQGREISFNWRTSDDVLLERINEALAE